MLSLFKEKRKTREARELRILTKNDWCEVAPKRQKCFPVLCMTSLVISLIIYLLHTEFNFETITGAGVRINQEILFFQI